MEALVFLLLVVIAVCFVLPLVAIAKATRARRSVEEFETRLRSLEGELQMLKHAPDGLRADQSPAAKSEPADGEPFVSAPIAEPPEARPASVPPPLLGHIIEKLEVMNVHDRIIRC